MTSNNRDLSRWKVAGQPFALECTGEVIEHLRRWTLTADLFPPERGMLWGTREGHTVRVLGVSQNAAADHPKQLAAVGWFQIRLERDIHLTVEDLLYHDECFAETGATILILRPASAGGVRVGVFFREVSGAVRAESSYQEVVLHGQPDALLSAAPITTIDVPLVKRPVASAVKSRQSRIWLAFGSGLVAGTLAGALAFAAMRHEPTKAPAEEETARVLTQQTRQLQSELNAEKLHSRRLEQTLTILRERARTKASPIATSSTLTEAQVRPANPVF